MEKKTHTKKERLYTGRGKIREKRRARGRKKPERKGKERGVIYASLGTRFYLFSPCELFYIGDLIKSNKSQHTRARAHTHTQAHTHSCNCPSWFSDHEHLLPIHPPNKSRLWCITRHIIHVVYRSKICKQTRGIKVIDAQMGSFFSSVLISHTAPSTVTYTCLVWDEEILYCVLMLCPHGGYLLSLGDKCIFTTSFTKAPSLLVSPY